MANEPTARKSLDVNPDLHKRLRIVAARDGVRIRDAAERAIEEYVTKRERRG